MAVHNSPKIIRDIARRYYIQGQQQSEIAAYYAISRSQVSKLLKKGREEGLVHIEIPDHTPSGELLRSRLMKTFSLKDVLIVPSGSRDAGKEGTALRVGNQAAAYLKALLMEGMRIGIEWGTSLYHMLEQLHVDKPYDVEVYQMHGVIESPSCDIEGFVLARKLARILGGRVRLIQAPMVVASQQLRDMLVTEQKIADTLEGARSADAVFIGIGSNETGENELCRAGYLSKEESLAVRDRGGTATISGWFLHESGQIMEGAPNNRMIGVHPDKFRDIPLVVAVAYGEYKQRSILSALKGGYIDVLATDEQTARGILDELEQQSRLQDVPREELLLMYERMLRSRLLDQRLEELFSEKELYGTTHLSIGQEASSVVPGCALEPQDYLFGTHRGHGHAVGKGLDAASFMAEMFGKVTGCAGGRGGSMHLVDVSKGIMGMNGVVAGVLPVAVGAALSARMLMEDRVSAVFLGDGATNEGAFHEAMNLAAVWSLPVLFLCENNLYGMSVHIERSMKVENLAIRASAYGMPGWTIDGNNALEVFHTVKRARKYAREHGPLFLVMNTYRISGHSKSDVNAYRTSEEIDAWSRRCPIARFRSQLLSGRICSPEDILQIDQREAQHIRDAEQLARRSPDPDPEDVMECIYS